MPYICAVTISSCWRTGAVRRGGGPPPREGGCERNPARRGARPASGTARPPFPRAPHAYPLGRCPPPPPPLPQQPSPRKSGSPPTPTPTPTGTPSPSPPSPTPTQPPSPARPRQRRHCGHRRVASPRQCLYLPGRRRRGTGSGRDSHVGGAWAAGYVT